MTLPARPQVNLADVQLAVAEAVGDRPAIVQGSTCRTHADVARRSDDLARALLTLGVPERRPRAALPGWESGCGHVAIVSRNRPEWIEAIYGSFKAGLAPFNVNYRYTVSELTALWADARPVAIVYESAFADVIGASTSDLPTVALVQIDADSGPLLAGAHRYEELLAEGARSTTALPERSPDDAYLLFTGGTTGSPKGVVWRQADIYAAAVVGKTHVSVDDAAEELALVVEASRAEPRIIMPLPPFMHGAAQWVAMSAMHTGDTIVLPPLGDSLDPRAVWRTIDAHGVQVLLVVGDAFGRPLLDELEQGGHDGSSLGALVTGGAATSEGLKRRFLERFPQAVVLDVAGSSESGSFLSNGSAPGSVQTGVFAPGAGTVLVAEDRSHLIPLDSEEIGWLGRAGPVPLGYLHDPDRSAATFVEVDGVRVTIPGDRARWTPEGHVQLLGRDSVTINTGGEKVFAEEVEQTLMSHPGVRDALAVGVPDERWGQRLVALVVDGRDRAGDDELLAHCRATLAGFKVPRHIVRVREVRRSPAGKPDYAWGRDQAVACTGT